MIERYCTYEGCPGGGGCINILRDPNRGRECVYEYVADKIRPEYNWMGEGPPPRRWTAPDGTIVYRCFADYCD
jgi:hypothetical protein